MAEKFGGLMRDFLVNLQNKEATDILPSVAFYPFLVPVQSGCPSCLSYKFYTPVHKLGKVSAGQQSLRQHCQIKCLFRQP